MSKWELNNDNPMTGEGEYFPVAYPRSGDDRDISLNNKGAASSSDSIDASIALNTTGNVNVPRHTQAVDYEAGDDGIDDVNESREGEDE